VTRRAVRSALRDFEGPLLFLIFINDISDTIVHSCKQYADDTKLLATMDHLSEIVSFQAAIDTIVRWSKVWLMRLNEEKCKMMHIGEKNVKHPYSISTVTGD
jgi:ribonuclease P/MRP protein subunit RPP40